MILKNQLNFDVCDMINKVAMKTYRDDMKWKQFEMIITDTGREMYDFIYKDDWAKICGVIVYETYDTKQKRDCLCKMFWYMFMNCIEEDEWDAYGEMFHSNKDKMFKIIHKYYLVNKWVEIDPTNDYINDMIKDKTLKFKKNGDVDKRCKAWKDFGRVINDKPVIYQRQLTRKILGNDWMEGYEWYELPEEELCEDCNFDWK